MWRVSLEIRYCTDGETDEDDDELESVSMLPLDAPGIPLKSQLWDSPLTPRQHHITAFVSLYILSTFKSFMSRKATKAFCLTNVYSSVYYVNQ